MKTTAKLWTGLVVLAILSPLGLFLPEYFKAGDAWGEWSGDTIKKLVGYVPQGLEKLSSLWDPPMPDYVFKGWEEKGLPHLSFAYIISAFVGISAVALATWLIGKLLSKKGD